MAWGPGFQCSGRLNMYLNQGLIHSLECHMIGGGLTVLTNVMQISVILALAGMIYNGIGIISMF